MIPFPPRRFPGRRRHFDSAAELLSPGAGLGAYRRGLGAAPSAAASAIAAAEGFGVPGTIPTRANNPGDLALGDIGYGVLTAAGGQQITIFPSADAGWTALQNQINKMVSGTSSIYSPGMSIAQVGQLYSGGSSSWASNVASMLGVTTDTSFASAVAGGGSATDSTGDGSGSGDYSSDAGLLASVTSDNTGIYIAGAAAALAVGILAFR